MSQTTSNGTGALFLCLDTSTPTARVAILDGDPQSAEVVRFAAEATAERHAGHLLPLCAEALRAVGVAPAALAGIACGGGPGSFTGLRVGLSTAKGLALPTGVPLHVVSSLEALALDILGMPPNRTAPSPITAVPCLDAGKGEIYVAAYVVDPERLVREVAPCARLTPAAFASVGGRRSTGPSSPATVRRATGTRSGPPKSSTSPARPRSPWGGWRSCSARGARPQTWPQPCPSTGDRPTLL